VTHKKANKNRHEKTGFCADRVECRQLISGLVMVRVWVSFSISARVAAVDLARGEWLIQIGARFRSLHKVGYFTYSAHEFEEVWHFPSLELLNQSSEILVACHFSP
jgi:hypothetical protein